MRREILSAFASNIFTPSPPRVSATRPRRLRNPPPDSQKPFPEVSTTRPQGLRNNTCRLPFAPSLFESHARTPRIYFLRTLPALTHSQHRLPAFTPGVYPPAFTHPLSFSISTTVIHCHKGNDPDDDSHFCCSRACGHLLAVCPDPSAAWSDSDFERAVPLQQSLNVEVAQCTCSLPDTANLSCRK